MLLSERKLETTVDETLKLEERLHDMTLERTIKIIKELLYMHETDPNFNGETLNQMKDFIANPPTTTTNSVSPPPTPPANS